ncbi:MAG: AmmeMemoRadiSam system protein B [Deltaproteobacteria bacterium]|nr:AmmeMemoRadiSam system protein B [Deltaproteobacteria bacterium]
MFETRSPAVAGRFYPSDAATLDREVRTHLCCASPTEPAPAIAVIAPHAGYVYSGAIAGAAYARVVVPRSAVVLCPNHTGMGSRRSLWPEGAWRLPGGALLVDEALAEELRQHAGLEPDALAHQHEHSLEVQLPFLQARNPEVAIVPICLSSLSLRECLQMGEQIAAAIAAFRDQVLLVASTDMTHFLSAREALRLDSMALEHVKALDAEGLYEVVETQGISMCGYLPTTVVLAAARALGARAAELVRYGHSGETSGDLERVVGYAGLVIR